MQNILKSKVLLSTVLALAAIAAAVVVIVVNVNQSGNDLQTQLDLGRKYVSELDYENAIIAYEKALEIDPYCSEAYFGLSDAYLALGQEDKAIEIMEQARNMLPDNVEVYISLAQLYASQNQLDLVVSTLERGIEVTGSDRLKAMLKEYQPDENQPELAKTDRSDGRQETEVSEESSSTDSGEEVQRPSVGIGLRQDERQQRVEPVLIIDRDDEEQVMVPLITPTPAPEYELPDSSHDPVRNSNNYSDSANQGDNQENNSNYGSENIGGSQGGGSENNSDTDNTPELPQMGVVGNVYGINGLGIDGVTIRIYPDRSEHETPISASTNTAGEYVQGLTEGTYRIVLSKDGYVDLETVVSVTNNALTSNSYVMLTTDESQQAASLRGVVISATNSQNVEGATVALLQGFDKTSNGDQSVIDASIHTTTESNGTFSIEEGVTAGYYTIEVSKDGYSTYHRNETVKPGENELAINMSPAIETNGVYRIVLTWGSSPRDLDSHLICTGNENYHVYFGNKNAYNNKASLDVDDTTSYGPETVTVEIGQGNSYIYAVHNYSDGSASPGEESARNLANSGAKVAVYDASGIIFDGNVPVGTQGITWEVFRIENGRLVVTNHVGFDHPSNLTNNYVSTASVNETTGTIDIPEDSAISEDQLAAAESVRVDEAKGNELNEAGTEESSSGVAASEAQVEVTADNEPASGGDTQEIQTAETESASGEDTQETQTAETEATEPASDRDTQETQTAETESASGEDTQETQTTETAATEPASDGDTQETQTTETAATEPVSDGDTQETQTTEMPEEEMPAMPSDPLSEDVFQSDDSTASGDEDDTCEGTESDESGETAETAGEA